ncbi:MAG: zinc ABC transporter substrate-binding protein [Thermodesulfobacteriota bacterium]
MRYAGIILSILLLIGLASCSREGGDEGVKESADNGVINVVATTGMIADIAQVVGGEHVKVRGLMGPGVDPHLYKASAGDVALLSGADLIFYNGLHLEGKMSEIFEQMKKRGIDTVAVTDGIDRSLLETPPQFQGNYDPHVWFDVTMWMTAVETVRDTLISEDPGNADYYRNNTDAYLKELSALNEYVAAKAKLLPEDKRVLITAHDAFNYFGRRYGFEVRGLQGISTVAEAGTQDVQNLAAFIVERKIPAIFVESSVPPKFIEAVQAAVQARGFDVKVGGSLYSDAMGNPGTPDGTYIGMVRHNIDTIVGALLDGGQS